MLSIARGVEDRDRSRLRTAAELGEALALGIQLTAIAGAELLEAGGVVREPAAQLVAGRQLAGPLIETRARV